MDVGVIGATGYVGAELLRLLSGHGNVNIVRAESKNFAGKRMGGVYPNFAGENDFDLSPMDGACGCDLAFLCLPHGQSIKVAPKLLKDGVKVIDLSGDFRYDDADVYEEWYGLTHTAREENGAAVYGLPEFSRKDIAKAEFVANPGCYTTTSILALAPLLKNGLISAKGIVIDAKSGVSGAGRQEKLAYAFSETADNFKAYSAVAHRHTSEIEEQLSKIGGKDITLLFTPHLLPVKRGILITAYAELNPNVARGDIESAYGEAYGGEPFTRVLPKGSLPELKHVVGSNNCVIGFDISERTGRIVAVSCTDNLIKGAAGQAVQNFNIMNGYDEGMGLPGVAWYL